MTELDRNPGNGPAAPAPQPGEGAPTSADDKPALFHHSLAARIRNYFLTGLVLMGPLYITINLTWWFINWVDDMVRPFIPAAYRPETYSPVYFPGSGLIIAFVSLTLLGFLTANLVGRTLVEFGENILNRMPVVRPIYKASSRSSRRCSPRADRASAASPWWSFPRPACGRWCFCRSPPAPISRPACRRPSTWRRSCPARPTRPPASSSTCRAAT